MGGIHRPAFGNTLSATKTTIIGAARPTSAPVEVTRSSPNFKKTPATIAITMGIGREDMIVRTQPVRPIARITSAVTTKAPNTSGHVRWFSEEPTTTVPGIVQKNDSGCRYTQDAMAVRMPLRKNTPNTHDASWAALSPPWMPAERITAMGPVAENTSPTIPPAADDPLRSRSTWRGRVAGELGRSNRPRRVGLSESTSSSVPVKIPLSHEDAGCRRSTPGIR